MGKVLKAVAGVALVVGVSILAPGLGTALAGFLGVSAAVGTAIATVGLSLAAGLATQALTSRPSTKGTPINFRNSVSNSFIIIGERRVGGKLCFYHPTKIGDGHFRFFIFASAGHRCKGVKAWFLNDEEVTVNPTTGLVTSGEYAGAAWLWAGRGSYTTDETPAGWRAEVGAKWSTDHKLLGVAKIFAKFQVTKGTEPKGLPTVSALWEGSDEIYDPRDSSTGYTRNAVLAFYWWMELPRELGGFGAEADEIPDGDLISAWANVCDEEVDDGLGGTEARYAFDSYIEAGAAPSQVRDTFVTCCAGSFTCSEGLFFMRPGYWVPPSATLQQRDLAGPIRITPLLEGDEVATEVNGTFVDPASLYQPAPIPTRSVASANVRQVDCDLAHVTSSARGQRILEIMLRRAQCEKRVVWPGNIALLETRAMQTVMVDKPEYGLNNYAWVIDGWSLASDFNITLTLREENEDIYAEPEIVPPTDPATVDRPEDIDFTPSSITTAPTVDGDVEPPLVTFALPRGTAWEWVEVYRDGVSVSAPITGGLGETKTYEEEDLPDGDYDWQIASFDEDGILIGLSPVTTETVT